MEAANLMLIIPQSMPSVENDLTYLIDPTQIDTPRCFNKKLRIQMGKYYESDCVAVAALCQDRVPYTSRSSAELGFAGVDPRCSDTT